MRFKYWLVALFSFYFLSHIISLTKLPIFADEAIYIRWAQMMYDDPKQFVFLPLYDGKTPLFMWLIIPLVNNTAVDPLWATRMVSVLFGAGSLLGIMLITKESGGKRLAQVLSMGLAILLPFAFFYSRMALIDMLLTMWLSFSFWSFLKSRNNQYTKKWLYLSGLFWGLGLLTKTSAFYYLPVMIGIIIYDIITNQKINKCQTLIRSVTALAIGLCFIVWLRVSPLFPFLFQRSSDFAYSLTEIGNNLSHILTTNIQRIGKWLWIYLTPITWGVLLLSISLIRKIRSTFILWGALALFIIPFLITGKLLSSRYFLPIIIWVVPLLAIVLEQWFKKSRSIFYGSCLLITLSSLRFIWPLYTNPGSTPLPNEDVVQYITEWSSGYGIAEIRDYLRKEAIAKNILVATEGYFGTLPDGLFIYFHNTPLQTNLEIIGVGQPIMDIPQLLIDKTKENDVYLVVNQHRLKMDQNNPHLELVAKYERPLNGPNLLFFKIKP